MTWFRPLFLVVPLAVASLGAADRLPCPATWTVAWAGDERSVLPFEENKDAVAVRGEIECYPVLRIRGTYRTRQELDPRSKLSFHIETDNGEPWLFDGPRSDWRLAEDGWREADFEIVGNLVPETPGLRHGLRVVFDYVVEHEYWQSRKFPDSSLPVLAVEPALRPAYFEVKWSWTPPIFPAQGLCWSLSWVHASFGRLPPAPYRAALDVLAGDGPTRIDAQRVGDAWAGEGSRMVCYLFDQAVPQTALMRPGFVLENVEWFQGYAGNPYRRVWVVGVLWYLAALGAASLLVHQASRGVARIGNVALRRAGWTAVACVYAFILAVAATSECGLVFAGFALLLALLARVREPGARLYWTAWGVLLLLDLYCLHVYTDTALQWMGTVLSAAFTGLVLLPLRLVRSPKPAAIVGTLLVAGAALLATTMMVYRDYFGDYPGVSDLLNAGQVDDVGDSVWRLIGQNQLVPCFLALGVCYPLWWRSRT